MRDEGVERRSQGSRGSVGAVRRLQSQAGGIPLLVLGVCDFGCKKEGEHMQFIMKKREEKKHANSTGMMQFFPQFLE